MKEIRVGKKKWMSDPHIGNSTKLEYIYSIGVMKLIIKQFERKKNTRSVKTKAICTSNFYYIQ